MKKWQAVTKVDPSSSNQSSVVTMVELLPSGGNAQDVSWRGLFCADSTQENVTAGLSKLANRPQVLNLVTLPHHGSHSNSDEKFYIKFPVRLPNVAYVKVLTRGSFQTAMH